MRRGVLFVLCCLFLGAHSTEITNTASLTYVNPLSTPKSVESNTVSTIILPNPTPATIQYFRYSPTSGEEDVLVDSTQCMMGSAFQAAPQPVTIGGSPIDNSGLLPISAANSFRAGEPMFVKLSDGNRNVDSALREYVEVDLNTSNGDHEKLKLYETGINTGVFMGVVNTQRTPPALEQMDCIISIQTGVELTADYVDSDFPVDTAHADLLVDPYGIVFDSSSGAPVDGVTVSMVNALTNEPATVFDDDGVTPYPSTIVTGGSVIAGANTYNMPPGGFRFPLAPPGTYKLVISNLPVNYVWPTSVPLTTLNALRNSFGNPFALPTGYDGSPFILNVGPPLNVDLPIDPIVSSLVLTKVAAKSDVSIGDFVRYDLNLRNTGLAQANDVVISDKLPRGFRFRKSSLKINGVKELNPSISNDGRTLSIPIGNLAPSAESLVSYVAEVSSDAVVGKAANRAVASRSNGISSNEAIAEVMVRDAFFSSHATIVGRVLEVPSCSFDVTDTTQNIKGIEKVKILMEDGSYVATDEEGRYHFEKVLPGTHVVQLDESSLPQKYETILCDKNTRFTGRAHSQFVDLQGGSLWRADFYVVKKVIPQGVVELKFKGEPIVEEVVNQVNTEQEKPDTSYIFRFDTLSSKNADLAEFSEKIRALSSQKKISKIHIIGHTDNQKITHGAVNAFKDNKVLSEARAKMVADAIERLNLGIQLSTEGKADEVPIATNETSEGRALNRRSEVQIFFAEKHSSVNKVANKFLYTVHLKSSRETQNYQIVVSPPKDYLYVAGSASLNDKLLADPLTEETQLKFTVTELKSNEETFLKFKLKPKASLSTVAKDCLDKESSAELYLRYSVKGYEGENLLLARTQTCEEKDVVVRESQIKAKEQAVLKEVEIDDITASGGNRDWFVNAKEEIDLLFPLENYNPRAPSTRLVVKHGLTHKVELKVNDKDLDRIYFERTSENTQKTIAISEWKGVPLIEGTNKIKIVVKDSSGALIKEINREIHYANTPAKIVFLPELSRLVANGVDRPRIAIRVLDKYEKPIRKKSGGSYSLNSPYISSEYEDFTQKRQLSGLEKFEPEYKVINDEGIAYIDLAATNVAGEVKVKFYISENHTQELSAWLIPEVGDWVVVGFVEGTAGYKTLKGNMEDLPDSDKNNELDTDSQTKLYAKGRVKGEWIMTLAVDSEKNKKDKQNNFKGIVDPNEFYTLYADNTTQKNDAPSSDKIYFKIEKSRFYALFGDYDAGLNDTQLARYNRSFTGAKSEYSGKFVGFKVFGTQVESNYFKEEIQGRGESFLYRLSKGNILVNSEKIRLVVRDRFRSDEILKDTYLTNHVDYNIDYRAGTINFKQVIQSTVDFNPQFIVVEYETMDTATKDYTYGGRVEGKFLNNKVNVGVTHIKEDDGFKESQLNGMDSTVKFSEQTELKTEAAESRSRPSGKELQGAAYLAELSHRTKLLDLSSYAKHTEENFGIGQQAVSESGSFKTGARSSIHLNSTWDLNLSYDHQKQLSSDQERDVGAVSTKYKYENGSLGFGYRRIDESSVLGDSYSNQATGEVTQFFFNKKVELQFKTEQNLGSTSSSADYPNRYLLQAGYKLTDKTKVFAAQEYTDGKDIDTSTTRVGFESLPWEGAKLGSTLNQSVNEAGPRTFSTMGLSQSLPLGERWAIDASFDTSQTLREDGPANPLNPLHPISSGGFLGASGAYTEDYVAMSAGATYRAKPWTWNFRAETRLGDVEDKYGFATHLLRELSRGIVLGTSHEYYNSQYSGGAKGQLFQGDFSLASRPLESRWIILDRLKYRYETVDNAASLPIFGQTTTMGIDNAVSSALTNNFTLNRLSKTRKNQFSLFYGAKVAWDKYGEDFYQSFTDMWGVELRQDIAEKWDVGMQGSMLHSWTAKNMKYSFGPSVGWAPATNSWLSLGYNFKGFYDSDFDGAKYSQQGLYLKVRVKFDEKTLGLKKSN